MRFHPARQIELKSFPQRHNARFRGLRKTEAGEPVDISADCDDWFFHQALFDTNTLAINSLSPDDERLIRYPHVATHLFVARYTIDSYGELVQLTIAPGGPKHEAVYLRCDAIPLVLEAHRIHSAYYASVKPDPIISGTYETIFQFLRLGQVLEHDVLVFSSLGKQSYE